MDNKKYWLYHLLCLNEKKKLIIKIMICVCAVQIEGGAG